MEDWKIEDQIWGKVVMQQLHDVNAVANRLR